MRTINRFTWSLGVVVSFCPALHANLVTTFASGFGVPETISLAPASFGLPAGDLVVADRGTVPNGGTMTSAVYSLPPGGGSPSTLASFSNGVLSNGGIFAPSTFGSLGGDYLIFGQSSAGTAVAYSMSSSSATPSLFYTDPNSSLYEFSTPVLAPSGFGAASGDILVPELSLAGGTATVTALNSSGSFSPFATISNFSSQAEDGGWGTVFAPAGFVPGTTGPILLVSDTDSGTIDWIDASGNAHFFTNVPLLANQTGLRQMAFAPAGFGNYGGDLFVSVSGSTAGGGTYGSVDVINSAGNLVGIISQGTVAAPFDPRGLYFVSPSQLLMADTDPAIYSAPPAAVTPVPEPVSIPLAGLALGLFAFLRQRLR